MQDIEKDSRVWACHVPLMHCAMLLRRQAANILQSRPDGFLSTSHAVFAPASSVHQNVIKLCKFTKRVETILEKDRHRYIY